MLARLFIASAFTMVDFIIGLLPDIPDVAQQGWGDIILTLIAGAGQFVPLDVFVLCIGNIIMWISIHLIISLIRFIVRFIPMWGG